jgi:hypothetical protein
MSASQLAKLTLAALVVSSIGMVSGCDSGPGGKPQSIATDAEVNNIVEMRKIFDKAGGNWDTLSSEEKAQFTKLAGDDAKAQTRWKSMSTPMGSVPGSS